MRFRWIERISDLPKSILRGRQEKETAQRQKKILFPEAKLK